jgi:hypothetical protein
VFNADAPPIADGDSIYTNPIAMRCSYAWRMDSAVACVQQRAIEPNAVAVDQNKAAEWGRRAPMMQLPRQDPESRPGSHLPSARRWTICWPSESSLTVYQMPPTLRTYQDFVQKCKQVADQASPAMIISDGGREVTRSSSWPTRDEHEVALPAYRPGFSRQAAAPV